MKRLGLYTGRIYTDDDFHNNKIHECCRVITDEQADNEKIVSELYARLHTNCIACYGCPESQHLY